MFDREVTEEMVEQSVKKLDELLNEDESFLGYGLTANVHSLDDIRGICCKINKAEKEIPPDIFVNSPEEELNILSKLKELHLSVRTPEPYCSHIIDLGKRKYLVMEQLNAVSVRDVLEGPEELPELFDFESFFKKLEYFVAEMHENGIYHRDLHAGNIMIHKVTGEPYVIDFGTGIATFRGDEEPYKVSVGVGDNMPLPKDEYMLRTVKENVKKAKLLTK